MTDYDARRDSFESYNVAIDAQRSKLLRSKAAPKASETKIQQAIVQYLERALPATYRFFAIPNGGARSAITGARLKREGVKRGIPDICIVRQGGSVAFSRSRHQPGGHRRNRRNSSTGAAKTGCRWRLFAALLMSRRRYWIGIYP